MTPTKIKICNFLNEVQREHYKLFDDLVLLKNFHSKKFNSKIVLEFQYKLASTLYRLATSRNEIIAAEKSLVLRKSTIDKKWFVSRMKLFKTLKGGIDNSITIGKSLGDAFASHFFLLNPKELFGQLEQPEIKIFPTGIGGLGELKFIKTFPILNEHFVILHGITNLLRVGDVSLFSLKDGKLTSVGEIKTKEVEPNKITISLTALNAEGRDFAMESNIQFTETINYNDYFDPTRFKRQIDKTADFLKAKNSQEKQIDRIVYDRYYVQELEEAVEGLKRKEINIKRVSDSFLFAASRLPARKASRKMFVKHDETKLKKYKAEIEKDVLSLLRTDKPNHPMRYGSIHFDSHFRTKYMIGVSPLFWYPIKPSVLKKIYFHDVFVMTMFNPTNFYSTLKEIGVEISEDDKTGKLFIGKKMSNGSTLKLQYFNYFHLLMEDNLHTPEAVIEIIKEMLFRVENFEGIYRSIKLDTEIFHLFTHYNQDNIS